jgi:hypothetical protein
MAKRYIDKTPEEIKAERSAGFQKRMSNLAAIGESAVEKGVGIATGIAKEEVFGIPGMFADLSGLAQYATNPFTYGTNEALQKASEDLIDDLGASALAAKAGVELSDEIFDEDGEVRPEMIGRMVAPGALYAKGAALIPELSSGVQSLVRGLRNDGFFPAGGPQPATVGGPSPMTQAPDDAGPRSMVVRSESQEPPTGGTAPEKPLVQAEKENRFVSPDNPAVDKPPQAALTKPGFSETGIYLPVKAALENIDIPAGGITGTKLLEKLRGQPRTGRDLTASGFADLLKDVGNNKIDKESALSAYDAVRNKMVVRTVMSNDFEYDGTVLPGERISYLGMQRQIGAKDTERNYGVMLFGDESAKIGDQPIQTVDGHKYFTNNLPTHFGHIRFSIQEILDPKTNQPIKALLVEEIQSDLVRAFAQAEQAQRSVKSVDSLKKALKKDRPDLDEDTINLMAENEHDQMVSNAEVALGRIFNDRIPYGPGERLADATLAASKDVKQYDQMLKDYKFAEDSDDLLNRPAMQAIEEKRNTHFNKAGDSEANISLNKLFLTSGIHKAKSADEAERMIDSIPDDVLLNMPRTMTANRSAENLNDAEIAANVRKKIFREWERADKAAQQKVQDSQQGSRGILSNLFKKDVEAQLTEERRAKTVGMLSFYTREKAKEMLAHRLSKALKDDLLKARLKPAIAGEETEVFYDLPDLEETARVVRNDQNATPTTVRKFIPEPEANEILTNNADLVDGEIKDAVALFSNEIRNLKDADPVFSGVELDYFNFKLNQNKLTEHFRASMTTDHLSRYNARAVQQAEIYRDNIFKKVEEAKKKAPTLSELGDKIGSIINDPTFGALFRERSGIPKGATAENIKVMLKASGTKFLSGKAAMKAGDYVPKPPFETQNDFIQFATRALMHEAGKMDVDAVVMPSVEEMILGRQEHIMARMSPVDKVKNVEKMKQVLAGEKRLREVKSKLQQLAKETDEVLTAEDFEKAGILEDMKTAFGFDSLLRMNANEYLKYLTPDGIKNTAKEKYAGGDSYIKSEREMRGHFQNSGEALDAALSGLVKEGFEIEELERLNAKTQDGSKYVNIGGYAQQGKPELAKYRMIDIRKGNKGADVAKKVPSAYNKGGHVDVRGGIGAMAREVM